MFRLWYLEARKPQTALACIRHEAPPRLLPELLHNQKHMAKLNPNKKHTHLGCFPLPSNREKQESSSFQIFLVGVVSGETSLLGGDVSGITDLSDLLPVHPCRFWVLLRCVGKRRDLGLGMKTMVITKICLLGAWKNDKTYSPNGGLMKWRWIPWDPKARSHLKQIEDNN